MIVSMSVIIYVIYVITGSRDTGFVHSACLWNACKDCHGEGKMFEYITIYSIDMTLRFIMYFFYIIMTDILSSFKFSLFFWKDNEYAESKECWYFNLWSVYYILFQDIDRERKGYFQWFKILNNVINFIDCSSWHW